MVVHSSGSSVMLIVIMHIGRTASNKASRTSNSLSQMQNLMSSDGKGKLSNESSPTSASITSSLSPSDRGSIVFFKSWYQYQNSVNTFGAISLYIQLAKCEPLFQFQSLVIYSLIISYLEKQTTSRMTMRCFFQKRKPRNENLWRILSTSLFPNKNRNTPVA